MVKGLENRVYEEQLRSQATRVHGTHDHCSQTQVLDLGWSCAEPGVGLDDPYGSLLTCVSVWSVPLTT